MLLLLPSSRHEANSKRVNRPPMPSSTPNASRKGSDTAANNSSTPIAPTGENSYTDSTPKAAENEHSANTKFCPLSDPAIATSCAINLSININSIRAKTLNFRPSSVDL